MEWPTCIASMILTWVTSLILLESHWHGLCQTRFKRRALAVSNPNNPILSEIRQDIKGARRLKPLFRGSITRQAPGRAIHQSSAEARLGFICRASEVSNRMKFLSGDCKFRKHLRNEIQTITYPFYWRNEIQTNAHKCKYAWNRWASYCPSFVYTFFATAPIGFVHIFQLWTFPEPWTLLFSFVIVPGLNVCTYSLTHKHDRSTTFETIWQISTIEGLSL